MNVLINELKASLCQKWIETLYGGMVPMGEGEIVTTRLLHRVQLVDLHNAGLESWRIEIGEAGKPVWAGWTLNLLRPYGPTAVPVLASGDACWNYINTEVMQHFVHAGVALAWFNRVELASDSPTCTREGPVFARFPDAGFGALSVWAWAYSRAVDALLQIPGIDPTRIGIAGHSRGGKAALLAGATDARIALTAANNSGTAGAASWLLQGAGSESLADLARQFPHWLAKDIQILLDRPATEGLDQDLLLSAIAPRQLLITQARSDRWANPLGTQHVADRVAAHYTSLGALEAFSLVWREGGHPMVLGDWVAVLGLKDTVLQAYKA